LKTLLAIHPNRPNRIIDNLYRGIRASGATVEVSLEKFWSPQENGFDIIHLQWPEALIAWKLLSPDRAQSICRQINWWKEQGSKIVITRHNFLPHYPGEINEAFYRQVYEMADGIIHLGHYSVKEFKARYPHLKNCKHKVIPHPWYETTPNTIDQTKARRILNIPYSQKVFLAFGNMRSIEEQNLVIDGFLNCGLSNKRLFIPRGRLLEITEKPKNKKSIDSFQRRLKKIIYQHSNRRKGIYIQEQFVREEHIQLYFNAADVVIIQRFNNLNSGNIPLGFTFSKVVVGPRTGNLTEILKETKNPIYDPKVPESLYNALKEGYFLSQKRHGENNLEYAKSKWDILNIGRAHFSFYHEVNHAFNTIR
jgi:hypothetical protein